MSLLLMKLNKYFSVMHTARFLLQFHLYFLLKSFSLPFNELSLLGLALDVVD